MRKAARYALPLLSNIESIGTLRFAVGVVRATGGRGLREGLALGLSGHHPLEPGVPFGVPHDAAFLPTFPSAFILSFAPPLLLSFPSAFLSGLLAALLPAFAPALVEDARFALVQFPAQQH